MDSRALVDGLKKELKLQSITYADLATRLDLSEAAVKRLFAEENFSLRRLDEICGVLGLDLAQLVRRAENAIDTPQEFPPETEDALAADPELLLAWYHVVLGHRPALIRKRLALDKGAWHRHARRLEALGLVTAGRGDSLHPKASKSARWRADGPLVKRYGPAILEEFFATDFNAPQHHQDFLTGALTSESYVITKRRMDELFRQFDELSRLDARTERTSAEQTETYWIYCGMRPWAPLSVVERVLARDAKR
jgi:transcriptional regulator with XRE-family HTH domain